MQFDFRPIGIGILVVATLALAMSEVAKRLYSAELARLLEAGDTDSCRKTLQLPIVCLVFPRWNRAFMELNTYLVDEDEVAIRQCFEELFALKANKAQKQALGAKAFSFYVEQCDKRGARRALELLQQTADAKEIEESKRLYEIYLEGSSAYIEEMKAALGKAAGAEKGFLELLLAVQYENRGDEALAQRYVRLAEQHTTVKA